MAARLVENDSPGVVCASPLVEDSAEDDCSAAVGSMVEADSTLDVLLPGGSPRDDCSAVQQAAGSVPDDSLQDGSLPEVGYPADSALDGLPEADSLAGSRADWVQDGSLPDDFRVPAECQDDWRADSLAADYLDGSRAHSALGDLLPGDCPAAADSQDDSRADSLAADCRDGSRADSQADSRAYWVARPDVHSLLVDYPGGSQADSRAAVRRGLAVFQA